MNNAGILRDGMSFNMSEEDWDSVIRVHLKGHFAPSRFAAVNWREHRRRARRADHQHVERVGPLRHGRAVELLGGEGRDRLDDLVLAREMKKYGVTVNAMAPPPDSA